MMPWQRNEALGKMERIIRKFREMIDTDSSIPPELRRVLHETLDEHLLEAKRRVLLRAH
ncbi:nucleoside-triphosphatase [Bradyrhizobium sacchari]|uniref:nucleoside-triphosphatase n=1 Tax=Bradyrhizobium sacchari TaxID=1399419 RepID=UPI001FD8EB4D|nr:nucleoside-triphosphatase [Bradyrhizobium sacchari]